MGGGINIKETFLKCLLSVAQPLFGGEYRKVDIFQVRRGIRSAYVRLITDGKSSSDEQKEKKSLWPGIFKQMHSLTFLFFILQFYGT